MKTKWILFSVIGLLLTACSANRFIGLENNLFPEKGDHVTIITVLPDSNSTNFIASSTLLYVHQELEKKSTIAYTYSFSPNKVEKAVFYNDSIDVFDEKSFPLLISPASSDTLSCFTFSLSRKSLAFSPCQPIGSTPFSYLLDFEKKQPFPIQVEPKAFESYSIPAFATSIQMFQQKTKGTLFLSTINDIEALLAKKQDNACAFYWLDFELFTGEKHSVFWEVGSQLTLLKSDGVIRNITQSNTNDANELFRLQQMDQTALLQIIGTIPPKTAKNAYSVIPVELLRNNQLVGKGVLTIL